MLEHGHQADAKGDKRLGQQSQGPDERAAQRIECIAAHARRAQKGIERIAGARAQQTPGFQDEGQLLLDIIAPGDKLAAVGQERRGQRKKRQQRAEKKRMRAGYARTRRRLCMHKSPDAI